MGKNGGPMTAKAISNKMKAKGLGRLRWYCQMCEKQCRDENGFQNHMSSESHKRMIGVFAEAPRQFIEKFSEQFRTGFLTCVRQRYGTKFVQANAAYQDYIKDRHHLHMNATRWTTLSEFVKELGKAAHCRVEEREDGWWISVIDRRAAERSREAREMDERLRDDEEYERWRLFFLMRSVEKEALVAARAEEDLAGTGVAPSFDQPIRITSGRAPVAKEADGKDGRNVFAVREQSAAEGDEGTTTTRARKRSRWGPKKKKLSALEEIMLEQQASKQYASSAKRARVDRMEQSPGGLDAARESLEVPESTAMWVLPGVVVKLMNRELEDGKYYKKKGEVLSVITDDGAMGARVRLLESGLMLELDQDDLETVIPRPGGTVLFVRGRYRGKRATLLEIDEANYCVSVRLRDGGGVVERVEYEHVSRVKHY